MDNINSISDAGLYTDFGGLQKLRARVSGQQDKQASANATKAVAQQFESLFLQLMLKSMREATITDDSGESDQTRFYQEMFDKQIALDLANNGSGGLGIAGMLDPDLNRPGQAVTGNRTTGAGEIDKTQLVRNQILLTKTFSTDTTDNKE